MSLPPTSSRNPGQPDPTQASLPSTSTPLFVELVEQLEEASSLDPVVDAVRPLADGLVADPLRRDVLRGAWLGHALHPLLTDLPIGFWSSAVALDLAGGRAARPAARRLTGLGVLSAVPAAVTGWAEWSGTGQREQRVGVVHASANVVALTLFAASWRARRRDHHLRGAALGLVASSALGVGGFLGGHLVSARKVSSRHPAFEPSVEH
jgi:uncharacterized membrane protein